jgi:hypothetical protein
MHNTQENKDLHAFIGHVVEDFTSWDVLLHFARSPESRETASSLSKLTGKEVDEIDRCLSRLVEQRILKKIKDKKEVAAYILKANVKNEDLLLKLKECLEDRNKRITLLAVALETIRDKKSRKKRRAS